MIDKVISDLYSGIGISDIEDFKKHLTDYNINLELVEKKISIEIAWNDLILKSLIIQFLLMKKIKQK